tara:strand:+ start:1890 stop:2531 length:642 start_codon:yes stop_codon:yes gene_type:complete
MGVAIGVMAGIGALGGMMGSMGQQGQQQQQYAMQKMEAEKQNYLNQRKTDEANWAAGRRAAIMRYNNVQIQEAAVKNKADMNYHIRKNYEAQKLQGARSLMAQRSSMIQEATGKNLRGGMVDRMKHLATVQGEQARINNRTSMQSAQEQADSQYKSMLNKRDTLTRQPTSMFVPSTMPVQPDSGFNLSMLSSMLGAGATGAGQGASIHQATNK